MTPKKKPEAAPPQQVLAYTLPSPAILSEAEETFEHTNEVVIASAPDSEFAQGMRAGIDSRIKELTDQRMKITRPMDDAKKQIMALFSKPIDILTLCRNDLTRKIIGFDDHQRAIAAEKQRRLDEAAEAEKRRLAKLAEKAQARGDIEKADAFRDRESMTVAPVVQSESTTAAGTSFIERWGFEVVNPMEVNPRCMMPDEVAIGKIVRSMGDKAQDIVGPGVRIFKTRSIQQRK